MLKLAPEGLSRPPDWEETVKGHGRIDKRAVWLFACEEAMQTYLAEEFGWPGAQWCGWIRRQRTLLGSRETQEGVHVWLGGAAFIWKLSAAGAGGLLRGHWTIENKVFYVRDVTMDEDRLHARKTGYALSSLRNVALSLLRRLGYPYIPDTRRYLAARTDVGLPLLLYDF